MPLYLKKKKKDCSVLVHRLSPRTELSPDPFDNRTMSAGDRNEENAVNNGSRSVDTHLIPVERILSINNLHSSVLVVGESKEIPHVRSTNSKLGSD